ncbi:MAG: cyanophycin synthetase, partial [Patescibacteria group bacterium]
SLEKVYQYLKSPASEGRVPLNKIERQKSKAKGRKLICVLGAAGGGRDKWKRPVMGRLAAKYCDYIVLTDEDPYGENSFQIISEIKSGIIESKFPGPNLFEILNRKEAIKKAIGLAKKGDVVALTGKGSEPWLHLARGKKIPWNEKEITAEILKTIL